MTLGNIVGKFVGVEISIKSIKLNSMHFIFIKNEMRKDPPS